MNYKDLNDNELIYYVKDNIEEAKDLMFKKYTPLIEKKARKYLSSLSSSGIELSDLVQEGLIAIDHAIDYFDEQKDVTFYTYINTCIDNRLINVVTKNKGNKFKALNEAISYEIYDEDGKEFTLDSAISDNKANPEELITSKEHEMKLVDSIKMELTDFENQVFDLRLSDFSYKEIADILDKSPKAIDNAIQRIKSKAKEKISS